MLQTEYLELPLTSDSDGQMTFLEWRRRIDGPVNSDMVKIDEAIKNTNARVSNLLNELTSDFDHVSSAEVIDIRNSYDGALYTAAGDAVRAIGYELSDLRVSLRDYIDAKAIDGLLYEDNKLYLTYNGQIISDPVEIVGGSGGGGESNNASITLTNASGWIYKTIVSGASCLTTIEWSSLENEIATGPGVLKVIVNGIQKHTTSIQQGTIELDISPWLSAGSNTVKFNVSDIYGNSRTIAVTITVVALSLTSTFDASVPYTGNISFTYTPIGEVEKTAHFVVDGIEVGTATMTASGRQQTYAISTQRHGSHTLEAYFSAEIDGWTVESNRLYYDLICLEDGDTTPVIASCFNKSTVSQFDNIVIEYYVYDPSSLTASIILYANDTEISDLVVDRTKQTWTYRADAVGPLTLSIACGNVVKTFDLTVVESDIDVEAETDSLALYLSSYGRSNNETNPGSWEFGGIAAEFSNFNFVSDGWKQDENSNTVLRVSGDARLSIPYKMFEKDFRATGKTIEFELATREVLNYDAEVISCFSGERGFKITAQQLRLASEQSQLGTRYKEGEHIRVSFVAEKRSENRLLLCYINGIMSGAAQYPDDDDFSQAVPVGITIGSNECTTDLYGIRVYDNGLTRFQVLNNWIADTQNLADRLARYQRNKIYDAYGRVVISQLPRELCYLVLQCAELPQFKGDKKDCSGYFVDLVHPERSFSFSNAQIDVQGTSSQYYWRKNYKIKFNGGFILSDGSSVTVYAMNDDTVPTSTYTMKADVASSEGYYNVVSAKLFNQYHPFQMPAQEADPRARYSIDGFPIVIFWDNGKDTEFLGKYNFNHDKGTSEPFGLAPGDERWEVLQNGTERVGFHSADFSGDGWKEDFEGNFPDGNTDLTNLKPMCEWVTSTKGDPAKFDAELAAHFVEPAVIYYYVFTEAFLCMDQREKNVLWRYIRPIQRWLADYYDADSIIGFNNQAQPVFEYWMEDIDYTASGDPVYNGQNSTFWNNLRETRADEIKAEWHRLRDAGFSYESVMAEFEAHKSVWPEAIYNEDMQTKCLEALIQNGDGTYLPFLRGDKWAWTQWFVYNRFRYLDSKYEYGSSVENRATIRTNVMANLWLTYYMKMYGHAYYNAEHIVHRVEKDTAYEFVSHASGAEDRVIGLNDADMITSLGDLAPHMVELIDLSKMVLLQELKLGDGAEDYVNNALNSVTFGNNILLRRVDLRNCTALTQALDLSGCANIEEAYFDGTAVTAVSLPNGGILKVLHLPETVTNLTVLNQKAITDFTMAGYSNVTTLRVENSPSIPAMDILLGMPDNSRVRIIGFDLNLETDSELSAFLNKLDSMRGLDENGNNVDTAQVSGSIYVPTIGFGTSMTLNRLKEKYPSLVITYDEVGPAVTHQLVMRTLSGEYVNDRVTYIGTNALRGTKVTSVSFPAVTATGEYAVFSDALEYADFPELLEATTYLFDSHKKLRRVNIPKVTALQHRSFMDCDVLEELVLPSATFFAGQALAYAEKLKVIDFHQVCTIDNAPWSCGSLVAVIMRGNGICSLKMGNFGGSPIASGTGFIYVPRSLKDQYASATNWSAFASQFRTLEDYTVDGTVMGELDESKI